MPIIFVYNSKSARTTLKKLLNNSGLNNFALLQHLFYANRKFMILCKLFIKEIIGNYNKNNKNNRDNDENKGKQNIFLILLKMFHLEFQ